MSTTTAVTETAGIIMFGGTDSAEAPRPSTRPDMVLRLLLLLLLHLLLLLSLLLPLVLLPLLLLLRLVAVAVVVVAVVVVVVDVRQQYRIVFPPWSDSAPRISSAGW